MRPAPTRPAEGVITALAALALALATAGCMQDATAQDGLVSLVEAHDTALRAARGLAPSASLVGFVGHEGPQPAFLRGMLADHYVRLDTSTDPARADGRTHAWALLFGTQDGGLIRAEVRSGAPAQVAWATREHDPTVQALWALNLGGRLLIDSDAAVRAIQEKDAAIHRHLGDHPYQNVVYASTVTQRATAQGDALDLAYEVFYDYGTGSGRPYAYFAQVSHFSGAVLTSGDHGAGEAQRTVTLVDERFSLGPVVREAEAERATTEKVYSAQLTLETEGNGGYILEVRKRAGGLVARIEEPFIAGTKTHEASLGTLATGTYVVHAEATGNVSFHLTIRGVVGL